MKKDSFWNQLISSIAGLGVPGLVLLVAMSATGYAGAAALTTALAALGGPLGMLGGIAVLGVLSMISKGLAAFGLDVIFSAVVDELKQRGITSEDILRAVKGYPIPGFIKDQIKGKIESAQSSEAENTVSGRRIFVVDSLDIELGATVELRELHSTNIEPILVQAKLGEGVWKGAVASSTGDPETVQIIYKQAGLKEYGSTSRSLRIGEQYRLQQLNGSRFDKVLIEVQVADGFWLGVLEEPGLDEEIVNIIYQSSK
jgi:hypothetical protein